MKILREGTNNFLTDERFPILAFDSIENYEEDNSSFTCFLDDFDIRELKGDIEDFNNHSYYEQEEDEDDYPVVKIRSGYYEGAQVYCDSTYLSDRQIKEVQDFFDELVNKYGLDRLVSRGNMMGYRKRMNESYDNSYKELYDAVLNYVNSFDVEAFMKNFSNVREVSEFVCSVVDKIVYSIYNDR